MKGKTQKKHFPLYIFLARDPQLLQVPFGLDNHSVSELPRCTSRYLNSLYFPEHLQLLDCVASLHVVVSLVHATH